MLKLVNRAAANNIADTAMRRQHLYAVHRKTHRANFTADGAWVGPGKRDDIGAAREWVWHAFAFLAGDEGDIKLANAILAATPNVANQFNPIAAGHVLLRHGSLIGERARRVLLKIINDGLGDAIDHSLAATGVNNFSAMRALLFIAASRLLERYDVSYAHKVIPDVYNRYRLQKFARNVLLLLEEQLKQTDLAEEFNSPTYMPITLLAIAEIVNYSDDVQTSESARRIERRLWQELLAFHHPVLQTCCGPFARGYEVDRIAHASNARMLAGLLGLSDLPVERLLYPPGDGQVIHGGDPVMPQAIACWLAAPDYHVPSDLLTQHRARSFPYEQSSTYGWNGMGYQRADGRVVLNVEGNYCGAGGRGVAHVWQSKNIGVGSMSESYSSQNVPCHVAYRVADGADLGCVRAATVMMTRADDLSNCGAFALRQMGSSVAGSVRPFPWLIASAPAEVKHDYRLVLQVSEHLPLGQPVERLFFNDVAVAPRGGAELATAKEGRFRIEDGKARLAWKVSAPALIRFGVTRSGGYVQCVVVLADAGMAVEFQLDVSERGG